MRHHPAPQRRTKKGILAISVALLIIFLLSACNGDTQTQQRASQSKNELDKMITHAQSIGVPDSLLQPIIDQEAQLSQTNAPITDQSATSYYSNLSQRYQSLTLQVQGLEPQATQQLDYQATLDLQTFGAALAQRQAQDWVETKTFADQLASDQNLMAKAQYPKQYTQISTSAKDSTQALHLMGPAYDKLTALQQTIAQLEASHLDVTAIQQQEQYDLQLFRTANKPGDFTQIIDQINTQLQETVALSTQAIPYVGAANLKEFTTDLTQLKQYGMDTTTYQKHLVADKAALDQAKTISDFLKVSSQINSDMASIQFPLLQGQTNFLLKQFHQEVTNWGNAHQYHDPQNGVNYNLDYAYDQQGIGSDADAAVQAAQTQDDYLAAIDLLQNDILHLQAMEADYQDKTPWDQTHATDTQLLAHYKLATSGQVIVVSLIEQALRLYQNGKLVKAFQVTTGQFDKPSVPGFWHISLRQSPTVFKSSEPKGSAFWYPDTKINFAMEYHDGGYFFHDSWWRVNYGPGTNFPHYDSGGDESFAGTGSHGCVNMQEDQAAWLYNNTGYGTAVIMY